MGITTRQERQAAGKKRAAASTARDELVAALEVEKAGYERRNLPERAKAVASEIAKHKAAAKKDATAAAKTGAKNAADGDDKPAPRRNRGSAKTAAITSDGDAQGESQGGGDKSAGDGGGGE